MQNVHHQVKGIITRIYQKGRPFLSRPRELVNLWSPNFNYVRLCSATRQRYGNESEKIGRDDLDSNQRPLTPSRKTTSERIVPLVDNDVSLNDLRRVTDLLNLLRTLRIGR